MISSVELKAIGKPGMELSASADINLWPPTKKVINIAPDFSIKEYYFCVKTKSECENVNILINGFEVLNLTNYEVDINCEFRTLSLSARYFLGFNLGLFELHLEINGIRHPLATLNNKQGLIAPENLGRMYETVAESDFFNFYISRFYRSNTLAQEDSNADAHHFWLRLALAKELNKCMSDFIADNLESFSRFKASSVIRKFNEKSVVSENDINWLVSNPSELNASSDGCVSYGGLRFDIENMSQTYMSIDFDTYENRLLLTSLFSIKNTLRKLIIDFELTPLFPHSAVDLVLQDVDKNILQLNSVFNLSPPFNTFPEYSNKFLDDAKYTPLFMIITRWHTINSLSYGNVLRTPILGITEIFEHFCFVKIIECLLNSDFKLDDSTRKDDDTSCLVKLRREDESVSIFYEPCVTIKSENPLLNSKLNSGGVKPDIVIIYEKFGVKRYGVIDAKFATEKMVTKQLAPEIFFKYGLFLHGDNTKPLDYVFAMYPSLNGKCAVAHARDSRFIDKVKPMLGSITSPFEENSTFELLKYLIPVICGETAVESSRFT